MLTGTVRMADVTPPETSPLQFDSQTVLIGASRNAIGEPADIFAQVQCVTAAGRPLSGPCRRGREGAGEAPSRGIYAPAKRFFSITAWTPQFPSTTWVTPKSTATDIREIASSSESPLVVMRK